MGITYFDSVVANMGVPLVWLSGCHLIFLNLFIGVVEGRWIARRTKSRESTWGWALILANYASAFTGVALLPALFWAMASHFGGEFWIAGAAPATILLPIAAFCLTVFLEGVFVLVAAAIERVRPLRAIRAFVVVQILTYLPLVGLYGLVSGLSAISTVSWKTEASQVAPAGIAGWVYYLSADDSEVRRCRLDGSDNQRVANLADIGVSPLSLRRRMAPLYAMPSDPETTSRVGDDCELRLLEPSHSARGPLIVDHLPGRAGLFARHASDGRLRPASEEEFHASWGAATVGAGSPGPTRARVGSGMQLADSLVGERGFRVAYQTPLLTWQWRSPTVVEGRYMVAGVRAADRRLVVLFDMDAGTGAAIVEGWSPVVVLETPVSASE